LLLRAIADLDSSEGAVCLDGRNRSTIAGPEWRRLVGYVPAEPGWWADTVGEHFREWTTVLAFLRDLGFPEDAKAWPIARLPTGERLRLALIRALMVWPKVLLLDEPTAALDPASVAAVESLITTQLRAGLAVLWVTHDAEQAKRIAHRILVVKAERSRRRSPNGQLHCPKLLGACGGKHLCFSQRRPLGNLWTESSSQLLIAALRMTVQLALMGLVLTTLFSVVSPLLTGFAALVMVLFAGHEAALRQERRLSGWWSYGLGTGCMMMSSVLVTVFALITALRPSPWYDPRLQYRSSV
jgi:phosphate-transporting ATPase